jgi:hypothetical protein
MSKAAPDVIPDELVLAAIDRAACHSPRDTPEVPCGRSMTTSGIAKRSGAARRVRARLDAMEVAGSVERSRRHSVPVWALTSAGRRRLQRARRAGNVQELPESPQHRAWRSARATAAQEIERFRQSLRDCLEETVLLLDADPPADSDAWFLLGQRLCPACRRLGAAVHCLREWQEPDDAHADVDREAAYGVGPSYRVGRRNIRRWESPERPAGGKTNPLGLSGPSLD